MCQGALRGEHSLKVAHSARIPPLPTRVARRVFQSCLSTMTSNTTLKKHFAWDEQAVRNSHTLVSASLLANAQFELSMYAAAKDVKARTQLRTQKKKARRVHDWHDCPAKPFPQAASWTRHRPAGLTFPMKWSVLSQCWVSLGHGGDVSSVPVRDSPPPPPHPPSLPSGPT